MVPPNLDSCDHNPMSETQGQWVMVDMLSMDQLRLLSIGGTNYSGVSLRKNLDPLGRDLLHDSFKEVAATGRTVDRAATARGSTWRVHVEPVLAPMSGCVVAALGIYLPEGAELPARPVLGAGESEIHPGSSRIETAWNDDLFALYELPRAGAASPAGDLNEWVHRLVAPEDRARMKGGMDRVLANPDDQRHVISYRIITGGTGHRTRQVESSARLFPDAHRPVLWLRSVSREVSELDPAVTPATADTTSGGLLRAAFDLAAGAALIAVDTSSWQFFMTSPNWSGFGLQSMRFGYLPPVIHPDDLGRFQRVCGIGDAAAAPEPVRFLHADGQYLAHLVTAGNGHADGEGHRYVVVRLEPAD
jgi:hypothetical protein